MPVVLDDEMEEEDPLILIKADNQGVTILTSLLKTINFCEKVDIFITNENVSFRVEEGKYVQAVLYMKKELFKTFRVQQNLGFKIPFKELLDCMKILGADGKISDSADGTLNTMTAAAATARSLQITYNGHGMPLCLALDETGMFTTIELKTEEPEEYLDYDSLDKQWEIIMDAKLLQEFFADLDGYCPEYVTIRVCSTCVEFKTNGEAGSLKISIPRNCTGIEKFCNVKEPKQATYKFSVLRYSFKQVQAADKVILRMLHNDILNMSMVYRDIMSTFGDFYAQPQAATETYADFDDADH